MGKTNGLSKVCSCVCGKDKVESGIFLSSNKSSGSKRFLGFRGFGNFGNFGKLRDLSQRVDG